MGRKDPTSRGFHTSPEGKAYMAEYRRTHDTKRLVRDANLRRTYGIGADEYDAMLSAAGDVCPLCSTPFAPRGRSARSPALDHQHVPFKLRGFVCSQCNRAMGGAGDSPEILENMAKWIRQHKTKQ